jgi:ATP adenylyltransferase
MNYLWSPWRMKYIQEHDREDECVFCREASRSDGPENLILYRGQRAFVILNRYPYTSGHLMVVPFAHQPNLDGLDQETRSEMMELVNRSIQALQRAYQPEAFNLGANIGAAAGAGVAGHVHMHVVPRWGGDTNFMSTVADTRVLPESLEETYRRLLQAWAEG